MNGIGTGGGGTRDKGQGTSLPAGKAGDKENYVVVTLP
jgi:hypothetical protein